MKRILLLGHTSFVGTGLEERLRREGFDVTTFRRGATSVNGSEVTGPVLSLSTNPHLSQNFDAVVNLVLLKDESLDANVRFARELASLVKAKPGCHLVHISSISSYSDATKLIVEDSETEQNPKKKGSYGSLKVATDLELIRLAKGAFTLSLVRPGFVIAPGLSSPIVGMGARVPGNGLLVLGSGKDTVPVVRRQDVHDAIIALLSGKPTKELDIQLLADRHSPSREEYLRWCASGLGVATWTVALPPSLWLAAGAMGKTVSRFLPKSIDPWRIARSLTRTRSFDGKATERALGLDISVDWRAEIGRAMTGQQPNVVVPAVVGVPNVAPTGAIAILGCGGIVRQKHLPALKRLGFSGQIQGYDPGSCPEMEGVSVNPLPDATLSGQSLTVVASPGPHHADAIPLLPLDDSAVLIEKPLCMSTDELESWLRFAEKRVGATLVLHNYRFKANVQRLLEVMKRRNPGRLLHAHLLFQSPSVSGDVPWRRNERKARTLLMDYGLHFLDIASMFSTEDWQPRDVRYTLNELEQTDFISGTLHSSAYDVSFVMRQGFIPREASIRFVFQNYSATLSFFPDELSLTMSGDDFGVSLLRAGALLGGLSSKIYDKLTSGDRDLSHAIVMGQAMVAPQVLSTISVKNLAGFYRGAFELAKSVYTSPRQRA
jgi:predicted dehydrogenase/nucleoside-diphosphate-sugar epimerase